MSPNGFALADGRFRVRWHWVKDVPNTDPPPHSARRRERKVGDQLGDAQEVEPPQGAMVLPGVSRFCGGIGLLLDDRSRAFYSMGRWVPHQQDRGKGEGVRDGRRRGGNRRFTRTPPALVPHGAHPNPYNNPYATAGFHGIKLRRRLRGLPLRAAARGVPPDSARTSGRSPRRSPLGAAERTRLPTHGPKPPEFKFGKLAGEKTGVDDES